MLLNFFYDDNDRYPDNINDGVSTSGEVVGDEAGVIETLLQPYLPVVPSDPLYNGSTLIDDFFYGYDPIHSGCQPVISINRFETQGAIDQYGWQDTTTGGDMRINTAHYNYCFK